MAIRSNNEGIRVILQENHAKITNYCGTIISVSHFEQRGFKLVLFLSYKTC